MRAIEIVKPGTTLGDIGHAIQTYAEDKGFSIVRDFCGHGLGKIFHSPPSIMHFGEPGTGPRLVEGMFFTIEPDDQRRKIFNEDSARWMDRRDEGPFIVGAI